MARDINLKDLPPNMRDELLNTRALRKVREAQEKYGVQGDAWVNAIRDASGQNGLQPWQTAATIERESRWNPMAKARGSTATGLGQIVRDTAHHLGVDPTNPIESIYGVARYLKEVKNQIKSDDFKEITKAYVLGAGGYNQYQRTGQARGAEQIPSVEKFLATSDLVDPISSQPSMTPVNPQQTSRNILNPFQNQGTSITRKQMTPAKQNKIAVNTPTKNTEIEWELPNLPDIEVLI